MNRKYTAGEYLEGCRLLRKYFDHPALTTDVIVGFPGETEEEFKSSKEMVSEAKFYETHIFKYSRRKGTRADKMENQIPEQVKASRSHEMIELGKAHQKEYMEYYLGKQVEILFEETTEINGQTYWVGHTREYIKVAVLSEKNLENQLVTGEITEFLQDGIFNCRI